MAYTDSSAYTLEQWYRDHPDQAPGAGSFSQPPATPTPPAPTPAPVPPPQPITPTAIDPTVPNALQTIESEFPWLSQVGLVDQLQKWVVQGLNADSIVAEVRKTPQWQNEFQGITRDDGSFRMNEAQYLATRQNYKQVLQQYGYDADHFQPADYASFFKQDIDPNELSQRMKTYDSVTKGPSDVRDAFYVYAGMKLSDEDMYLMTSDPQRRQQLQDEYNARVTASPLDYNTWVTRATEAGLDRVVTQLQGLQQQGVATGGALDAIRNMNPDFARQMTDALYHGADSTKLLSLNELMHSFDIAMIGGAAVANGLQLPDADKVEAIRTAGISRAQALAGYQQIASQQNELNGALQRSGRSAGFTQSDFEQAMFLHTNAQQQALDQAQAAEKSLGQQSGAASMSLGQTGRLEQRGLQTPY